jgi:hypothetical protein
MSFVEDPPHFEVRTQVSEVADPNRCVVERPAIVICASAPSSREEVRGESVEEFTAWMYRRVIEALGLPSGNLGGFLKVPMSFLKQFRDVAGPTAACFQSIVLAKASLERIRSVHVLQNAFEMVLMKTPSLDIAGTLGLEPTHSGGQIFAPKVAFRVDLDFTLPYGETLWQAS